MYAPQRLGPGARSALESSDHELFLSAASYWEICLKVSVSKLKFAPDWQAAIDTEMARNRIKWLPIEKPHL